MAAIYGRLINKLSAKAGRDVTTPDGAAYLRDDIESVTGERLSLNTVKRLTGVIRYYNEPRISTLEILAHYLGYSSWKELLDLRNCGQSGLFYSFPHISLDCLPADATISFTWEPGRSITFRHIRDHSYEVVSVVNSNKLQEGDILHRVDPLVEGGVFWVDNVYRNGEDIGSYYSGPGSKIDNIKIE